MLLRADKHPAKVGPLRRSSGRQPASPRWGKQDRMHRGVATKAAHDGDGCLSSPVAAGGGCWVGTEGEDLLHGTRTFAADQRWEGFRKQGYVVQGQCG